MGWPGVNPLITSPHPTQFGMPRKQNWQLLIFWALCINWGFFDICPHFICEIWLTYMRGNLKEIRKNRRLSQRIMFTKLDFASHFYVILWDSLAHRGQSVMIMKTGGVCIISHKAQGAKVRKSPKKNGSRNKDQEMEDIIPPSWRIYVLDISFNVSYAAKSIPA